MMKVNKVNTNAMRSNFLRYGLILFLGISLAGCTKCSREEGVEVPPAVGNEQGNDSTVPSTPTEESVGEAESMGEPEMGADDSSMPTEGQGEDPSGSGDEWPDEEPVDVEEDHD